MKRALHRLILAALLCLPLSSAFADAAPPPPTPEARLVALMSEVGGLLAPKQSCDDGARALNTWLDAHLDALRGLSEPLRARARSLSPEAQAALDQALAPHIEAVMGFAMTCAEHPAARASFQRFGELQPGQARDPRLTAPAPAQ